MAKSSKSKNDGKSKKLATKVKKLKKPRAKELKTDDVSAKDLKTQDASVDALKIDDDSTSGLKNEDASTLPIVQASTSSGGEDVKQKSKKESKEKVSTERSSGFIFMCNAKTKPECYRHSVFGLPLGRMDFVEKVVDGAKLFLFDTDMKLLYGIYKAVGNGGKNLEPRAFGGNFPAQVKFKNFKDCLPLPESSFRHAIEDNYVARSKFKPELSNKQVKKLIALFQPVPPGHLSPAVHNQHAAPVPRHVNNLYAPSPALDPRHLPPATDPYYQRVLPQNPVVLEHDVYRRYVTVPEVAAAVPRQMVPMRQLGVDVPHQSYLRPGYEEASLAGFMRPGYEDPRVYSNAASNMPVSSLYSFAGAPPSYRGL